MQDGTPCDVTCAADNLDKNGKSCTPDASKPSNKSTDPTCEHWCWGTSCGWECKAKGTMCIDMPGGAVGMDGKTWCDVTCSDDGFNKKKTVCTQKTAPPAKKKAAASTAASTTASTTASTDAANPANTAA